MRRRVIAPIVCLTVIFAATVRAADAPPGGEVELHVDADRAQPTGWPIVVEVTVKNIGATAISWWSGGPDQYPGADHFVVEVRYGADRQWRAVNATNGQYREGSGVTRELKPGDSIVAPLAIPVKEAGGISFTIRPRDWRSADAAAGYVQALDDRKYADERIARVIEAAMTGGPPFWRHLAERYAGKTVLDAMLKLVTVDNAPLAGRAARVLARQPALPPEAGDAMAELVTRWLPRSPLPQWAGLREDIVAVALNTRAEPARAAVIEVMNKATDEPTRWIAINALRLSPGDKDWLRRAKEAIAALSPTDPVSAAELDRQKKLALEWLQSRITTPQ